VLWSSLGAVFESIILQPGVLKSAMFSCEIFHNPMSLRGLRQPDKSTENIVKQTLATTEKSDMLVDYTDDASTMDPRWPRRPRCAVGSRPADRPRVITD
jgi:hypothetical protein